MDWTEKGRIERRYAKVDQNREEVNTLREAHYGGCSDLEIGLYSHNLH